MISLTTPLILRAAGLLALWIVLSGSLAPAELAVGLVAATLGAWASAQLAPPRHGTATQLPALAVLALRLPVQVLLAGIDVAMRALSPRLAIRPGLVAFSPKLSPGPERDAFLTLASLLPGSVPAGPDGSGRVVIHALDTDQPVAAELAKEEARFARAIGADV